MLAEVVWKTIRIFLLAIKDLHKWSGGGGGGAVGQENWEKAIGTYYPVKRIFHSLQNVTFSSKNRREERQRFQVKFFMLSCSTTGYWLFKGMISRDLILRCLNVRIGKCLDSGQICFGARPRGGLIFKGLIR